MTRKIRDATVIGQTGLYFKETIERLNSIKMSFYRQIDNMLASYSGSDASAIANVLYNAINKIDALINAIRYYSEYMKSVANYDIENIEQTNKKLQDANKDKLKNLDNFENLKGVIQDEFEQFKY